MNIKETYELLKTTPVRTDAISLFDYISKNEEYKEFAFAWHSGGPSSGLP